MTLYRLVCLDSDRTVSSTKSVDLADDEAATIAARALIREQAIHAIEIWDASRLVADIPSALKARV